MTNIDKSYLITNFEERAGEENPQFRKVLWADFHIYGILSIQSVPYLIWYSLILERRVL
jgi:hypothetical protein